MFGAKLSWCQIVHFYYLGAKLSAFIILVPNCPVLNCPTIIPSNNNKNNIWINPDLRATGHVLYDELRGELRSRASSPADQWQWQKWGEDFFHQMNDIFQGH